jgi:hypothetical protein
VSHDSIDRRGSRSRTAAFCAMNGTGNSTRRGMSEARRLCATRGNDDVNHELRVGQFGIEGSEDSGSYRYSISSGNQDDGGR